MSGFISVERPISISGKFLRVDGRRFLIKGVSYGTFAPDADGAQFPDQRRVAQDFAAIAALNANTVRTYTPPPMSLLDEAAHRGLRLIVGVPWMQHVAFLERRQDARAIRRAIRDHVRQLANHPAAMLFTLGNEIPPSVVRWYGRARIEQFLEDLYDEAKAAAPESLLAYINYPPTEFLETPFFDVCAFNVFLHEEEQLSAYLARLHHIAGSRPLLISEVGADSVRNGQERQAALVGMQVRTALSAGACGAVVFTWTDDWWRGGCAVDDWAFGLVDTDRHPKPVYGEVQQLYGSQSVEDRARAPRVSVVVCAYNAADTIGECLQALAAVNYPNFEVIVVNDGSRDRTGEIAARYSLARVIDTPQSGLSAARNVGLENATGEIVAYTDADVRVDPEWLTHLVQPYRDPEIGAAGGPAIVPGDDPWFAQCVARAPGSPTHVLLDDRIAEHVPGCNCSFRREALRAIGGFNRLFLRAGDDVDVCWRIQEQGWKIGFAPAAVVWHRHRASTRAYWRQQIGYGEGETWLLGEHPDKFVRGRISWHGHIYSPLPFIRSLRTKRINAGPFGTAGFPSIYRTDTHPLAYLPHSGRWQVAWVLMLIAGLAGVIADVLFARALLAVAVSAFIATVVKCGIYGLHSDVSGLAPIGRLSRNTSALIYRFTIAWLHLVQPFARLWGRLRGFIKRPHGHGPARRRKRPAQRDANPIAIVEAIRLCGLRSVERLYWSRRWIEVADVLHATADRLRQQRAVRQIELDSGWWEDRDLTIGHRAWFRLDVRALVEDHGSGNCLHRVAVRARLTTAVALPLLLLVAIAAVMRYSGAPWSTSIPVAATAALLGAAVTLLTTARNLLDAIDVGAIGLGMSALGRQDDESGTPTPVSVPSQPAGQTLTTRAIAEETGGARRAVVGEL